ncbi:hypothetical protein TKK_0018585 [Trichogramma kaykai]
MSKRSGTQLTLNNFLTKKSRIESSDTLDNQLAECNIQSSTQENLRDGEIEDTLSSHDKLHHLDFGYYFRNPGTEIEREMKIQLLKSPWVPDSSYTFPASTERNLRFQHQWLKRFNWLVYSQLDGAFCKYCFLFADDTAGKGDRQHLKSLVKEPFKNWKKAIDTFKSHENHIYHKNCIITGTDFLSTASNPKRDVLNVLDVARMHQIQENREKLHSIINTIILCGRQEIALRGTDDYGPLSIDDEEPIVNDGNFRAILRMRVKCGDENLKKHVKNAPLNAMYMSPTIQNEIIDICGTIINKQIVSAINETKVFSILADETADISGYEQMTDLSV